MLINCDDYCVFCPSGDTSGRRLSQQNLPRSRKTAYWRRSEWRSDSFLPSLRNRLMWGEKGSLIAEFIRKVVGL